MSADVRSTKNLILFDYSAGLKRLMWSAICSQMSTRVRYHPGLCSDIAYLDPVSTSPLPSNISHSRPDSFPSCLQFCRISKNFRAPPPYAAFLAVTEFGFPSFWMDTVSLNRLL